MPTVADLSRSLNSGPAGDALPPLILMTDADRLHDPEPALAGLPRGSAVLLRHYADLDRPILADRLAVACRQRGLRLLIGADANLAAAVGADGVHWPERLVWRVPRRWRCWRRRRWLVTAAAHSLAAVHRAAAWGVDAVLVSPVFRTASHPEATPLGLTRFAAWASTSPVPVYALGGVGSANACSLINAGACGFAGIGLFGPEHLGANPEMLR